MITFSLFVHSTYSQTPTNHLELLKSKTWIADEYLKCTIKYTDTEVYIYMFEELIGKQKYHLSDKNSLEASYDPAKVGLIHTGRWIFYEDGKSDYYEFLTPTQIKFGTNFGDTFSWTIVNAKP